MVRKQKTEPVNGPDFAQSAAKGPPLHSLKQHADALVNTVSRGVNRAAAAFNLTPLEFALIRLFLVDLEWTATELAHMLSVNASVMSRAVTKLVDRGVLHRRRPRKDRRVVLLKLTEEGVALGLELHERAHSLYVDSGLYNDLIEVERGAVDRPLLGHQRPIYSEGRRTFSQWSPNSIRCFYTYQAAFSSV